MLTLLSIDHKMPLEQIMPIQSGDYHAHWHCVHCGGDFRAWLQIPGEDRRAFLRIRSNYDITNLLDDRCPCCGAPYAAPPLHAHPEDRIPGLH